MPETRQSDLFAATRVPGILARNAIDQAGCALQTSPSDTLFLPRDDNEIVDARHAGRGPGRALRFLFSVHRSVHVPRA